MTREIKFRAWDKIGKKLFYSYPPRWAEKKIKDADGLMTMDLEQVCIGIDGTIYLLDECGNYTYLNDEIELMQYTGLRDKNGKEIYEGDIVKFGEQLKPREVVWGTVGFSFHDGFSGTLLEACDYGEIIGNIYENPELIKK